MPAECYSLTAFMAMLHSLSDHRCEWAALGRFENPPVLYESPKWSRETCHVRNVLITQECQVKLCLCVAVQWCKLLKEFFFFFYTSPIFSAFYSSRSSEFRPVISNNARWFLCQQIGKAIEICNCARPPEGSAHKRGLGCLFLWRWWKVADLRLVFLCSCWELLPSAWINCSVSQQELLCWCFTGNPNVQRDVWLLTTALFPVCFGLRPKKYEWNYS